MITYHLDRQIRILGSDETRSYMSYPWSISEISENGEIHDSDLVPWPLSIYLHFTGLSLNQSVFNDWSADLDANGDRRVTENRQIHGALFLGADANNPLIKNTRCSFFGTHREITKISLSIELLQDNVVDERCEAEGTPGGEWVSDFDGHQFDDELRFRIYLAAPKFESIARPLELGNTWTGYIRVKGASGFYAYDSPMHTTSFVKILAPECAAQIDRSDDLRNIEPPMLGSVEGFTLKLAMRPAAIAIGTTVDSDNDALSESDKPADAEGRQPLQIIETLLTRISSQLTRLIWIFAAVAIYVALR